MASRLEQDCLGTMPLGPCLWARGTALGPWLSGKGYERALGSWLWAKGNGLCLGRIGPWFRGRGTGTELWLWLGAFSLVLHDTHPALGSSGNKSCLPLLLMQEQESSHRINQMTQSSCSTTLPNLPSFALLTLMLMLMPMVPHHSSRGVS